MSAFLLRAITFEREDAPTTSRPAGASSSREAGMRSIDAPSLAPNEDGDAQSAIATVDRTGMTAATATATATVSPEIPDRVDHPLSQLPTTLAGMEDALQRLATRPVDAGAVAAIIDDVRHYGARAFSASGTQGPVTSNAQLMDRARQHLDAYYQAIGLAPHDLAALHHANHASGRWYPTASMPVNLLQYAIPAFLGAAGHPYWSVGLAGVSAAFGFLLTGMLQQPLAVLPSEHTAERQGPVIQVDKGRVNYKRYLPVMAPEAGRHARQHLERIAGADLTNARDPELAQFLSRATEEQRTALRATAERCLGGSRELDQQHRLLLATEGAHERQMQGVAQQRGWRVLRPVGQGALGLLSGVDPRSLDPAAVADQLRRVGRQQRLSPMAVAGLQLLWLVICQVGQHASAGADETSKVTYKALLDMAFADLVKPGEGADRLERGLPLNAEHIDADRCRARVLGPVQSLAKRVERALKCELARTTSGSSEQASLQRQLKALREGRFTALDGTHDLAGRMLLQAPRQGIWASMFNTDSALNRDISARFNRAELAVQWTQRGTQTFHLGIAGSAVSSMSTRIATTASGGASWTPTFVLVGVLLANSLLSWIAAWSSAETQTLKNFGKEGEVPHGDAETGVTTRRPSTASQIGHGLRSGPDLLLGRWRAQQASSDLRTALSATAEGPDAPLALARELLDALEAWKPRQ